MIPHCYLELKLCHSKWRVSCICCFGMSASAEWLVNVLLKLSLDAHGNRLMDGYSALRK